MKRVVSLFALLLVLTSSGCGSAVPLADQLDQTIAKTMAITIPFTNHRKETISYYVPTNVGILEQQETSSVFVLGESEFLFTLNVTNIIAENEDPSGRGIDISNAIYTNSGMYTDVDGSDHPYTMSILDMGGAYYVLFDTPKISFYGLTNPIECDAVVQAMIRILKSAEIDDDTIIATYDREEAAKSEKIELDLFDEVIPENGRLEEIVAGTIPPQDTPLATPTPSTDDRPIGSETPQETQQAQPTTTPQSNEFEDIYQESGDMSQ